MQNSKCKIKIIINFLLIFSLLTPAFGLAQTTQAPQTVGEVETLGKNILERLPDAIKNIWQNQAVPIWLKMWAWTKNFWASTLGSKVQNLWEKLWGLTDQETPDVKGEFQKEKQEMQKDLWERFKELIK